VETEQAAANLIETNKLPLAILVNGETRGGAVSLAAILRDSHQGLVYGSATQGTKNYGPIQPDITVQVSPEDERAYFADAFRMIQHTNQLATGNVLTNEVGGENQPTQRVRIIGSRDGGMNWKFTGENQPTQRVRITEADLVRQRLKDTGEESLDLPARPSEPQVPLVNDPVLARALDFLKGLAIVREAKF
jgi:hypothetical protein